VKRLLLALAAALVVGAGAGVAVALTYAVSELYLAGHDLEPDWFGPAANVVFTVVVGVVSIATFAVVWRLVGRRHPAQG